MSQSGCTGTTCPRPQRCAAQRMAPMHAHLVDDVLADCLHADSAALKSERSFAWHVQPSDASAMLSRILL